MAKWVKIAVGAALIAGTLLSGGALAPALASFLISAGTGLVLSGIGSLLSKGPLQGISTATRNPIAPWNVLYGRGKLGGTIVYINQWGSNNAWIDLVIGIRQTKPIFQSLAIIAELLGWQTGNRGGFGRGGGAARKVTASRRNTKRAA